MFDAILLASYGGPECLEEIEPFLDKILFGKYISEARRAAIVERYRRFNGKSPLPQECRKFMGKLQKELACQGLSTQTYLGNLYAAPSFDDAFEEMERDGIKDVLVFSTSAFGSSQSCQRYREAIENAFRKRSSKFQLSCKLSFIPPFFDLPSIQRTVADDILTAIAWDELNSKAVFKKLSAQEEASKLILFSAHSIPTPDGERACYRAQLLTTISKVLNSILAAPAFGGETKINVDIADAELNGFPNNKLNFEEQQLSEISSQLRSKLFENRIDAALVFQSRSGSPRTPWLGPSAKEYLRQYSQDRPQLKSVIVSPIGFFFDNMETIYDLDVELRNICDELGLAYSRTPCIGSSPRLVDSIVKLARLSFDDFYRCHRTSTTCDLSCRL